MSRVGKRETLLPEGVSISVDGDQVIVKGPKGEIGYVKHKDISVEVKEGKVGFKVIRKSKESNSLWGTTAARVGNMIKGVTDGFHKDLELQGVGYRAALSGKNLEVNVGFSHPVIVEPPEGIGFEVDKEIIRVIGIDSQVVGQVAADIRAIRKPEPYKGKGIRYKGEVVRRKAGKVMGAVE